MQQGSVHLPCLIALHFIVVLRRQGWLEGPEVRLCMRQHKQLHHSVTPSWSAPRWHLGSGDRSVDKE